MLASYGAKRFAEKHGFKEVSIDRLLAPVAKAAYQKWKQDKPEGINLNEAGGSGDFLGKTRFLNIIEILIKGKSFKW